LRGGVRDADLGQQPRAGGTSGAGTGGNTACPAGRELCGQSCVNTTADRRTGFRRSAQQGTSAKNISDNVIHGSAIDCCKTARP
jgi:hypothetical protein